MTIVVVGYLPAKFAQEKLIEDASMLYSITQATQFFEFLPCIDVGRVDVPLAQAIQGA